ncbi:MAG: hypothetical protein KAX49_12530 [Halanaerobiales bacterium]|nr:hypothetical protein [Halanaerobiales bacterium]
MNRQKGIILLELLIAILILEFGILGVLQLFISSSKAYLDTKVSLQALELLRGEMERLEKNIFDSIKSHPLKELEEGIWFSLEVVDKLKYKILKGRVEWKDYSGIMKNYEILTYKSP